MVFASKGRKKDLIIYICFPSSGIFINKKGDHREVIKQFWGRNYLVGCRRRHPFVFPNVDYISITNPPSGSLFNHF